MLIKTYTGPTHRCKFKWPWMALSDSKIFNDTEHRDSLQQLSFLISWISLLLPMLPAVIFCRAMLCISAAMPSCGVRLSVRHVCVFCAKHIFNFFSPSGSPHYSFTIPNFMAIFRRGSLNRCKNRDFWPMSGFGIDHCCTNFHPWHLVLHFQYRIFHTFIVFGSPFSCIFSGPVADMTGGPQTPMRRHRPRLCIASRGKVWCEVSAQSRIRYRAVRRRVSPTAFIAAQHFGQRR